MKRFLSMCKKFGYMFTFYSYLNARIKKECVRHRYEYFLERHLLKSIKPIIKKYSETTINKEKIKPHRYIWVYWNTGFDNAPELVKVCLHSIIRHCSDWAEVRKVDLNNLLDYVDIPKDVMNKYRNGLICQANFSDIVRFALLSKYGGMWVDATIYATDQIPMEILDSNFYTLKVFEPQRFHPPTYGRWNGFFWSGVNTNIVFNYMYDSLIEYWRNNDDAINYIFHDFILRMGYERVLQIKEEIDAVKPNEEEIWYTLSQLNSKYSNELLEKVKNNNIFHKLSYKEKLQKETSNGELTLYGYFCDLEGYNTSSI